MRKSIYVAAIVVLGGVVYAAAAGLLQQGEPDLKTCERALALLSKGDRAGFDVLFEQWPDKTEAGKATTDELTDSQAPGLRAKVKASGKLCGVELVHADEVSSFLRRYIYVCKYERGRIACSFTFYKPADDWRFESYHFDSDDNALFSECGRCVSLPEGAGFSLAGQSNVTETP